MLSAYFGSGSTEARLQNGLQAHASSLAHLVIVVASDTALNGEQQ